MRVTADTKALEDGLRLVGRAVERGSTLPVLNNVLLQARGDHLRVEATNLEVWLTVDVPANVEAEGGATVPGTLARDLAKAITEEQTEVSAGEATVRQQNLTDQVAENEVTVKSGIAEFRLRGLPAAEWASPPDLEEPKAIRFRCDRLATALRRTVFAASPDETRPILTGVLWRFDGKGHLHLVSTDTHRLAEARHVGYQGETVKDEAYIVPAECLREVARIIGRCGEDSCEVLLAEGFARFCVDGVTAQVRVIEGQFPSYERVLPEQPAALDVDCDRKLLVEVLRRARVVANQDAKRVVLCPQEGGLRVTASSDEVGQGREETVPASVVGQERFDVAFNVGYLLDACEALPEAPEVRLSLWAALRPGTLTPLRDEAEGMDAWQYVLMPMQVM
jgi:DNA polymerase-3 subunit beta